MSKHDKFEFVPIGFIDSCFKQKFTIPRQPGLVKEARAKLVLLPEYNHEQAIRGIEQFSHLWILFVFHASTTGYKKLMVRPPRLGGKQKMGVFATRSNFRPNPIGQSVVKLERISHSRGQIELHLSGGDFLDKTPVLDIKPYIPFAESIPDARAGIAEQPPERIFKVEYSPESRHLIERASQELAQDLFALIDELLSYDPRPAFYEGQYNKEKFFTTLYGYELAWTLNDKTVVVIDFAKNH